MKIKRAKKNGEGRVPIRGLKIKVKIYTLAYAASRTTDRASCRLTIVNRVPIA